jgi:hypothetical protein
MSKCIAQNQLTDSEAASADVPYWVCATIDFHLAARLIHADSLHLSASNGHRLLMRGMFFRCS